MTTSRLAYTVFAIGLSVGIQIISASSYSAYAQITPPPNSGSPGTTTGGGSRS
ncbi:hypothetical protein Q2T42_06850 [Leptolyngbya boryana CZ1]|uniref:Uncharacterized protein n=1 Tax=Leptolyngbya boryana CZ1 TaxID=3060204 RepID=A0AA96WXV6_LEPBY|nr:MULTISPECIES: hypothetical protein [Leptolyngbya]MBD2369074.1 hypothetical protein [Leptolyngbya sp. FACHB-161]MBD2375579.1 hypothetical protein [Leptolyngbya sp. FACHB-238]MBD2400153.1 hypothetical protein [Leptolyngbya sp. FACHB-239]MBD2406513.1 hypothetical protein [Leptolyngbya sp. FACHB-402]ULP29181.1 hypothetical protein MCP04_24675 [Leptolyngbya boryana IU 594]